MVQVCCEVGTKDDVEMITTYALTVQGAHAHAYALNEAVNPVPLDFSHPHDP